MEARVTPAKTLPQSVDLQPRRLLMPTWRMGMSGERIGEEEVVPDGDGSEGGFGQRQHNVPKGAEFARAVEVGGFGEFSR
jgi:hypothetical protein